MTREPDDEAQAPANTSNEGDRPELDPITDEEILIALVAMHG